MRYLAIFLTSLTLSAAAFERKELAELVRANQFDQAFVLLENELSKISETNSEQRAQLISYQGELFLKTQRHDKAEEAFAQAISIREKIPTAPPLMLESHLRLARAQWIAQQRVAMLTSYENAITIAKKIGDRNVIFGLNAELAELFLKMGDVTNAWKLTRDDDSQALSDPVAIHWFSVRSKVSFASGSYAEAYQWLRLAKQRWEKTHDKDPQTGLVIAMESCALAQRLNRNDDARMQLLDAKKIADEMGKDHLTASLIWSLAVLDAELSELGKEQIYQQMVATFERCKTEKEFLSMGSIISAQVKLASLALDAKDYSAALNWCDQLDKRLPTVDSFRSLLHRYRAAAYFHQHKVDLAEKEAIASAEAGQQWLQKNRLFGVAENIIGLENSVDLLSPLMTYARADNRASLLQHFLFENHDDGLSQWIQLRRTLHQGDQRNEMRNLILDAQAGTEHIGNQLQQWSKLHRPPKISLEDLPHREVLVHYFIYHNEQEETHYAAIVCGRNQQARCVDLGLASVIHSRVKALLTTSEMQATDASYKGTSPLVLCDKLYELLWAPLNLTDQEVIIRPAGMLQFVPWSILHQPSAAADAGYLCQRHRTLRVVACSRPEVRNTPLSVRLSLLGVAEQKNGATVDQNFLVQGEKFIDLPGVLREFSAIEETGIKPVYRNTKMTANTFRDPAVLSSSMLHISCHGFVLPSDDPLQDGASVLRQSGLVFHDYGKSENGFLYAGDVPYLALDDVHAVVLSLCRGGLSNHAGLENWSSLRRAFLAAGVAHVAAAQWEIVDDDMQYFMRHLYAEMQRSTPLPAALQRTQCDWIAGKIPHAATFSPAMRIATGGAWVVESAGW